MLSFVSRGDVRPVFRQVFASPGGTLLKETDNQANHEEEEDEDNDPGDDGEQDGQACGEDGTAQLRSRKDCPRLPSSRWKCPGQ